MLNQDLFSQEIKKIRQPAVSGQFYSDNPEELKQEITSYLSKAKKINANPQILISPHAGFVFSGPVAAMGYANVNKNIKTVIIIGPSHHAYFEGVSIADFDAYMTPLGIVPIEKSIVDKLRKNPIVCSNLNADVPEHSLEVQLPFLQIVLNSFSIVPIVIGKVEPSLVADMLIPFVNEKTLVVASSDFSHYHSNKEARKLDDQSIKTILSGDTKGFLDACGEQPIRIVMHIAKKLSLTPVVLDARTSYDTAPQYGGSNRVVGYVSVAYIKKENSKKTQP